VGSVAVAILANLGVRRHECCYVGDSVEDIRMAKAAGVKIYSMATGTCSKEELVAAGADRVVASLKELSRLISSG